jgi:hypothetical protein
MAEMGMKETWTINLDINELRLVLKALGSRLKPEDLETANELEIELSRMRANVAKNKIQAADRLLQDIS